MALLLPHEYNEGYFTGVHPGGYTSYQRWHRVSGDFVSHSDSTGEFFADLMKYYKVLAFLDGKKVLELGCAKGYSVQWLREQGIEAWGMDVSAYAISQADPVVQPYLINANAVTQLSAYGKNAYNVIYSRGFLCCLSDQELSVIIPLMNKVGFLQIHHVDTLCNPAYYNVKTVAQLSGMGLKRGTVLVENDNIKNPYQV